MRNAREQGKIDGWEEKKIREKWKNRYTKRDIKIEQDVKRSISGERKS